MIFHQPVHRLLQYRSQLEFVRSTEFPDHIPEPISHPSYKMDRQFPAFPVLTQMLKEKIIQAVLDDILYHIMPPVLYQEQCKRGQIPVGQRPFVNTFQDLTGIGRVLSVELITQVLVKSIVKIIL